MLLAACSLAAGDDIFFWMPCGWRSAALSTLLAALPVSAGGDGIPFVCPFGWRSAVRNILLVAVPRGTAVPCCLPCGRQSAALRILLPRMLNHVKSQRDNTRPVAPRCKFRRRKNSSPLRTAAQNKSAHLGESLRSTHELRVSSYVGGPGGPCPHRKGVRQGNELPFLCDATKLPAATACRRLGKFGVGRSSALSNFSGPASVRRGGKCYPFCSNAPAAA
jgi:hypothetical protein